MSRKPLSIGDTVMVYIDNITPYNKHTARTGFGFIRYIGFVPYLESGQITQSVGIELIEQIHDGHNGVFNNTLYFNAEHGYGVIIPITNIIKILSATELMLELKKTIHSLQEKKDYIEQLESIISCKDDFIPRRPPQLLLTKIDVNLPPYHAPLKSEQHSFVLPESITPITPISPNTPHYKQRSSSYPQFPTAPVVVRTPSASSRHSISSSFPTISFGSNKDKLSKPESSITGGDHINQYHSTLPSAPTTPITPFTPTSPNSPNVIHEEVAVNDVIHETTSKYTDTLHPHREYSMSTSLSKRVSSLYKQPIPELRSNCDKKKSKKYKKRKKRKQNLQHND